MTKVKVKVKIQETFNVRGIKLPVRDEVAGGYLMALYKQSGRKLTPQIVVDDAKKKHSILHDCFEWDNEVAGEKYRLHQARHIINCISVRKEIDDKQIEVRAFINVQKDKYGAHTSNYLNKHGHSYYVSIDDAMDDPGTREYTLDMAKRELSVFKHKYGQLCELERLFIFMSSEALA